MYVPLISLERPIRRSGARGRRQGLSPPTMDHHRACRSSVDVHTLDRTALYAIPDRLPVVERAQRVCGSTYRACCKTPAGDSGEPESRCPHYNSCAYIAQFTDDRPALRLFAHNHLDAAPTEGFANA